jgi:hypothetical protein
LGPGARAVWVRLLQTTTAAAGRWPHHPFRVSPRGQRFSAPPQWAVRGGCSPRFWLPTGDRQPQPQEREAGRRGKPPVAQQVQISRVLLNGSQGSPLFGRSLAWPAVGSSASVAGLRLPWPEGLDDLPDAPWAFGTRATSAPGSRRVPVRRGGCLIPDTWNETPQRSTLPGFPRKRVMTCLWFSVRFQSCDGSSDGSVAEAPAGRRRLALQVPRRGFS